MAKTAMKLKQQKKPKFSTRAYTRCKICGRPHAVLRKYGICRVCFRELAYKGSVFEVQQPSDTTFRLYDWDRVGPDGHPREMQIEKALEAIDLSLGAPVPAAAIDNRFFSLALCKAGAAGRADSPRFVFGIESKAFSVVPAGEELILAEPSFVATGH